MDLPARFTHPYRVPLLSGRTATLYFDPALPNQEQYRKQLAENLVSVAVERLTERASLEILSARSPDEFFYGDAGRGIERQYIPRTLVSLEERFAAETTTLAELVDSWLKARHSHAGTPILLVGESGAGKTTEQYKLSFDLMFHRVPDPLVVPYLLFYNPFLQGEHEPPSSLPFELLIHRDLDLTFELTALRGVLTALQPTVFLFDLSDVEEANSLRVSFFRNLGDFHRRYPHHLLLIAYRTNAFLTGDPVLGSIAARDHQVASFRPFKFLALSAEQITNYYLANGLDPETLSVLDEPLQRQLSVNPLTLHLLSQIPKSENLTTKGQLYLRFIHQSIEEIQRRTHNQLDRNVLKYISIIAFHMCTKSLLQVPRSEIAEALGLEDKATDEPLSDLVLSNLLQPVGTNTTAAPAYRFKLLHDSFVFFFGAYRVIFRDANEPRTTEEWTRELDSIVFRRLNPNFMQAILYIPGLLYEIGDSVTFERWLRLRYTRSTKLLRPLFHRRVMTTGNAEKNSFTKFAEALPGIFGNLGRLTALLFGPLRSWNVIWIPRRAKENLLEIAYGLADQIDGFSAVIEASLADSDKEIRSRTIEHTINIMTRQTRFFNEPGDHTGPVGALAVLSKLCASITGEWERTSALGVVTKFLLAPYVYRFLPRSAALTLHIKVESLFHLLIIMVGRYLYSAKRDPDVGAYFAQLSLDLLRTAVARGPIPQHRFLLRSLALLFQLHYRRNTLYPCNYSEIKRAIARAGDPHDPQLPSRAVISEIAALFLGSPALFRQQKSRIMELSSLPNGLISWYLSTILSIYANTPELSAEVVALVARLINANTSDSIPCYVAFRTLHSFVTFSRLGRQNSEAQELFERISIKMIERGRWVVFSEPASERRYDNEVLLYYGEYLCAQRRRKDFDTLFRGELDRAVDIDDFRYVLTTLSDIARKHEYLVYAIELLGWLQKKPDLATQPERIQEIVRTFERMLPYNPFVVGLAWSNSELQEVRSRLRASKKSQVGSSLPVSYFGDAVYQNMLLLPWAREAFGRATLRASQESRPQRFFQAYVQTVAEALPSIVRE